MASKQNAKIGRQHLPINNQLVIAPYVLSTKQISDWVSALNTANSRIMPRRRSLYELFERVELDAQVETVTNLRTIAITNKMVNFVQDGVNENNPDLMGQIRSPWFNQMIRHIISAKYWGHSLIEFVLENGVITACSLVKRENVMPEKGLVLYNYADTFNGMLYREQPESDYCFEVYGDKRLGIYSIITPYVLYKAGALGDMAQFCELFSIPYREINYNPYDPDSKRLAQQAMEEAGSAGYVITPEGTSLKFHETNQTGANAPDLLMRFCDEQIAKAFLGGTMNTDNGSSQSQATVHYDVKAEINLSDMIWVEYILNWEVKPRLEAFGLPVGKGLFKFDDTRELSLPERIKLDIALAQEIEIPADYWYKTYKIPEPEGGPKVKEKTSAPIEPDPNKNDNGSGGGKQKGKK